MLDFMKLDITKTKNKYTNYSGLPFEIQFLKDIKEGHSCLRLLVTAQNWFPLNTLIKASNSIRNLHANSRNNVMLSFKFIFQVKATFFTSYLSRKIYFKYAFNIKRRYFCPWNMNLKLIFKSNFLYLIYRFSQG